MNYQYKNKEYRVTKTQAEFSLGVCPQTKDEATRFAVFNNETGELIAGPIVRAGNVSRRPFFGPLWNHELVFGFEYTDRPEENGRYQVWVLK